MAQTADIMVPAPLPSSLFRRMGQAAVTLKDQEERYMEELRHAITVMMKLYPMQNIPHLCNTLQAHVVHSTDVKTPFSSCMYCVFAEACTKEEARVCSSRNPLRHMAAVDN